MAALGQALATARAAGACESALSGLSADLAEARRAIPSEPDRAAVLGENAARFLGIPPR